MNVIHAATQKIHEINYFMSQSKINLQSKKFAFSKSLIAMKCFKYLICVLLSTEY